MIGFEICWYGFRNQMIDISRHIFAIYSFSSFYISSIMSLLIHKLRRQRPNTRQQLNRKFITISQILLRLKAVSDACRSASQDDCPWLQRRSLRAKAYDFGYGEDQITVQRCQYSSLQPKQKQADGNLLNATFLQAPPILQPSQPQLAWVRNCFC